MICGILGVFEPRLVTSFVNLLKANLAVNTIVPIWYQMLSIILNGLNPNVQLHQYLVLLDRNVVIVSSRVSRWLLWEVFAFTNTIFSKISTVTNRK